MCIFWYMKNFCPYNPGHKHDSAQKKKKKLFLHSDHIFYFRRATAPTYFNDLPE